MRSYLCYSGVRIAIHQPQLFSYKGYFDLIASADKFVFLDDAKFSKSSKYWFNRNKFPEPFTFRLEKHSDYAKFNELYFFNIEEDKLNFKRKFPNLKVDKYLNLLEQSYNFSYNVFLTTKAICDDLQIKTPMYFSSEIPHRKFVGGILDIVKKLGGDTYINVSGGRKLYNQDMFGDIKLEFLDTHEGPSILCLI